MQYHRFDSTRSRLLINNKASNTGSGKGTAFACLVLRQVYKYNNAITPTLTFPGSVPIQKRLAKKPQASFVVYVLLYRSVNLIYPHPEEPVRD